MNEERDGESRGNDVFLELMQVDVASNMVGPEAKAKTPPRYRFFLLYLMNLTNTLIE
jgi:hypothetical protein